MPRFLHRAGDAMFAYADERAAGSVWGYCAHDTERDRRGAQAARGQQRDPHPQHRPLRRGGPAGCPAPDATALRRLGQHLGLCRLPGQPRRLREIAPAQAGPLAPRRKPSTAPAASISATTPPGSLRRPDELTGAPH